MSMCVNVETLELQDESFLCSTQQGCRLVFSLCATAAVRQAVSRTKVSVDHNLLATQHLAVNQHGLVLQLDLNAHDSLKTIHQSWGRSLTQL